MPGLRPDHLDRRPGRRWGDRQLTEGARFIPIAEPSIGPLEKAAVLEVLDSGMLVQGPRVLALEEAFARIVGVRHAVATSSGTTGLHLALLAHGIGPGDEVITSPFTFVASVNSILYTGATPVFADIDPATYNISPAAIEKALSERTKAIMPVHLYGQPSDMAPIVELASRHGLTIVEDAAQAIGASYAGRMAGAFGTGVFSLYATKNVMAGEGGIVTTDDDELADRLRLLRAHGMRRKYVYELLGYNFRLSDLHAAIALAQIGRLDELTEIRQSNAALLSSQLRGVGVPCVAPDRTHVWHQYTIRLDSEAGRDAMAERLLKAGIGTAIYYPHPVHRFEHVQSVAGTVKMPESERAAEQVLSIPVHPGVSEDELTRIVTEINRPW